jgi:hypothetical protein
VTIETDIRSRLTKALGSYVMCGAAKEEILAIFDDMLRAHQCERETKPNARPRRGVSQ